MFFIMPLRTISFTRKFFLILGMVGGISQGVWGKEKILTAKEKKCDIKTNFFHIVESIDKTGGIKDFKACSWSGNAALALWGKLEDDSHITLKNFCSSWKKSLNLQNFFKGNGRIELKCGKPISSNSSAASKKVAHRK
ncbi:MAG: hypothetical protein K2P90_01770 [Holosporales bacterium]|nr:hypothetical protein [Holosporales bacterium]